MFNKGIKIIGYGIAWIMTIWWLSLAVSYNDVAEQYEANTWKELTINENDLINIKESVETKKRVKEQFQTMNNELICNGSGDDYNLCTSLKLSFNDLVNQLNVAIDCDSRIISKNDLKESDISFCLNASMWLRDIAKNIYIISDWTCNSECEESLEWYEYNIAMFQTYLNNIE